MHASLERIRAPSRLHLHSHILRSCRPSYNILAMRERTTPGQASTYKPRVRRAELREIRACTGSCRREIQTSHAGSKGKSNINGTTGRPVPACTSGNLYGTRPAQYRPSTPPVFGGAGGGEVGGGGGVDAADGVLYKPVSAAGFLSALEEAKAEVDV